jgi:RNA polymerase sigma-70 factor (ECF subfamily)
MSTAGSDAVRANHRPLVREHLPEYSVQLYKAAYALCGSREDAEDLVQETYARVLCRPRWLHHSGGELAYLRRVLRNIWFDTLSWRATHPEFPLELEHAEFAADWRADPAVLLDARGACAAIADLSAPLRETIVAVDIVGLSYKEAACTLRIRAGTVMSRLYQARRKVAERLEGSAT